MKKKTTDINKIKKGAIFTWGSVIAIHEIGEYVIVEYHPWKDNDNNNPKRLVEEEISFHIWVNGLDTSSSADSLDAALAVAIAYKHEGPNERAAAYFMRMIGVY